MCYTTQLIKQTMPHSFRKQLSMCLGTRPMQFIIRSQRAAGAWARGRYWRESTWRPVSLKNPPLGATPTQRAPHTSVTTPNGKFYLRPGSLVVTLNPATCTHKKGASLHVAVMVTSASLRAWRMTASTLQPDATRSPL